VNKYKKKLSTARLLDI